MSRQKSQNSEAGDELKIVEMEVAESTGVGAIEKY